MVCLNAHQFAFIFGLLGNIVSFFVFFAPLPTFVTICKKKSSDGYQAIPYSVALSSATLLLYYGYLKTNATMIISINAFGCAIEVTYLVIYMIYASKQSKMLTLKMLLLLNVGGLGMVMGLTMLILKTQQQRVSAVGWICAAFNLVVFAAPMAIMRKVIKTKSVEFMPFTLSLFLTINAVMWFFYGLFVKDMFIALPNVLGFLFGIAQMTLYMVYRNAVPVKQEHVEAAKFESTENEMKSVDDMNRGNSQNDNIV